MGEAVCRTCDNLIVDDWERTNSWAYWRCRRCKHPHDKTGLRANTVLANSNLKYERWILLMWNFAERGKTFQQIMNACCLPSDSEYKENFMSTKTVAKWNQFFRYLCVQDYQRNKKHIGEIGQICEIDESLFGKKKYGKGDGSKRRQRWVFGGIMRETSEVFMKICPGNKRTKKVLWPLLQSNVTQGTTVYSDGWKAYRKLPTIGYPHRWLDHSKYYVDPNDPTLNTNKIEGAWQKVKNFLPSSGAYNLEQQIDCYLWFCQKKLANEDAFWALVRLVSENNSIEKLNEALNVEDDTIGFEYTPEEAELDALEIARMDNMEDDSDDSDQDSSDDSSDEDTTTFNCPYCQASFPDKDTILHHLDDCMK